MDLVSDYSGLISLPTIVACVGVAFALLQLVPSRLRLEAALAAMVTVLTVSRLPEIGIAAGLAKLFSGYMFLLVGIAAIQRPGKKLSVPMCCWAYVITAVLAIFCVIHAADRTYALVIRVQWLILVVSALLTLRTIVNERALRRVLAALLVGMSISCLITLSALITDPLAAIHNGYGRFMPYGCNPNLIGLMYATAFGLGLYFSLTTRNSVGRTWSMICTALATGLSLLTVSRGAFLVIGLTAMPSCFRAIRNPIYAFATIGLLCVVLSSLSVFVEACDFDRIGGDVRGRTPTDVFEEIEKRPYWGLGFSEGLYVYDPDLHAHNAYLSMLYLGGIAVALPMFSLQTFGLYCSVQAWLDRRRLPIDPLLIGVLSGFSVALFTHGFVNEVIYHPTYTWAFLNVLIPSLFIVLNRCPRRNTAWRTAAARAIPTGRTSRPMARQLPTYRLASR